MIINNIGINFAGGGGGGSSAVLESKDYSITQNGTTSIHPSEGVDGISGGTITVAVPDPVLESKNYTINTTGDTTITPSQGVNGISGGTISVSVTPSLTADTFTENGTYTPGEGIDGFSSVTFAVPETQENRLNSLIKNQITAVTQSDLSGVTTIPNNTFYGKTAIKTINLPTSVTGFGNTVFCDCSNLTTINTENVINYGNNCFQRCYALTAITFSSGATGTVPSSLLDSCRSLSGNLDVYFTSFQNSDSFSNCTGLTSMTCMSNVTAFPSGTYQRPWNGCTNLEYIDLTQIPTLANTNAFTSLTANYEIRVPSILLDSWKAAAGWSSSTIVDHIVGYPDLYATVEAKYTTTGNSLTSFLSDGTMISSEYDATTGGTQVYYGNNMFVTTYRFQNNKQIVSLEITGSGVTTIGYQAFQNATNLTDVKLNEGLTSINGQAFQGCTGLTSIDLPSTLTAITGGSVFNNCKSLTDITIPENVTIYGANNFSGCTALTSVTINASAKLPNNCFSNTGHIISVEFGPQVSILPAYCFVGQNVYDNTTITGMTFQSSTPPTCDGFVFHGFSDVSGTIYCPADAVDAYTTWKNATEGIKYNWTVQAISS